MALSDPLSGIWTDDFEGIPNGWMENYLADLSGNKIIQRWTHDSQSGSDIWVRTDDDDETVYTAGGGAIPVASIWGNSFGKLTFRDTGGLLTRTQIYQILYLTETELNQPMRIYYNIWQNLNNINTTSRVLALRIGYSQGSSELFEKTLNNTTLNFNTHTATFTSSSKTVYFTIHFGVQHADTNDYIFIDGFGAIRAPTTGSELAIQKNLPITSYSSEALISNSSWSSEALISNSSWSSEALVTGTSWSSEALISNTTWS